jgi:DivIVA domain-containing protein
VDRDGIERQDFPTGRRGYDPEAVHAHLRRVADEFDALRDRAQRPPEPPPLSAGTSEQVRVILEAAERSAAELRAKAGDEAGAHVARVEEVAQGLLGRLGELERQLGGLVTGLEKLRDQVSAATPAPEPAPHPAANDEPPAPLPDPAANGEPPAPLPDPAANGEPPAPLPDPAAAGDEAGARLIALNMALGGSPREETARYLAEHFSLADPEALLDDVYARADQ